MNMAPRLRKLLLTVHVASSVGTLGAVAAFFVLAVAGMTDAGIPPTGYVAMETITWMVIVPLVALSLLSGLLQSLGTSWGLFQHYWVLIKFLLTILVSVVLLLQTGAIATMSRLARDGALPGTAFFEFRLSLAVHAGAGLLVLLVAEALSVYKPRGLTRYGQRCQRGRSSATADDRAHRI